MDSDSDLTVHERHWDQMQELQELQERLADELVAPDFDVSPRSLGRLERLDARAAAEVRRHPQVYLEQRRILLQFADQVARGEDHAA